MALSSKEVQQRVLKPVNREQLNIAVLHEDRVKFCVKKCLEYNRPVYTNTHLFKIGQLLPIPKYQKYVAELSFPLPIMETADIIYSGLYKIWDAQNKAVYPILSSIDLEQEFTEYLEETNFFQFWETTAWQAFRNQPNSIMVIDMDVKQVGQRPMPYICTVDITAVKDVTIGDDNNTIEDLIFVNDDGQLVAVDDQNFYTYEPARGTDGKLTPSQWVITDEAVVIGFHGLGYCPATFLVQDALDNMRPIIKESPVTKMLYAFEKLLFRIVSGENLEDYASYPIHVIQKTECEYQDASGNRCVGGFVNVPATAGFAGGSMAAGNGIPYQYACPTCSSNHLVGAGSAYEGQPDEKGTFDLDNVVKIVSAPVETLQYIDDKIEDRKNNIIQSCIGMSQDQGQAKNEKQIVSMFEDRQTILMRTKRNFERAIKFTMDTIGKLMYESAYTNSVVNLGSRFLLATVDEWQARLDGAIESNAPQYEINLIRDEMNITEYSNNPRMMQRIKILEKLEPYANMSELDFQTLYSQNKISQINFELKYNFAIFIAQFEDENGDITDFGSLLEPAKKIAIIKTQLIKYVNEYIKEYGATGDSPGASPGKTLQVA